MEELRKAMEQIQADPEMQKAMKQFGMDMNTVENSMNAVENNGFGAYYEFEEFMTPTKFIAMAPIKIGICAIIAQRVNKPKAIRMPPIK